MSKLELAVQEINRRILAMGAADDDRGVMTDNLAPLLEGLPMSQEDALELIQMNVDHFSVSVIRGDADVPSGLRGILTNALLVGLILGADSV